MADSPFRNGADILMADLLPAHLAVLNGDNEGLAIIVAEADVQTLQWLTCYFAALCARLTAPMGPVYAHALSDLALRLQR